MEKIVLKGIFWGADKIPDKAFDKVPGHFYSPKEDKKGKKMDEDGGRRSGHHRHNSSDNYDDRPARHGDGYDDYDDGYRSNDRRQPAPRGRHSYDGGDDYDEVNNRPRRPRSRVMKDEYDDDDLYESSVRYDRQPRDRHHDDPPFYNDRGASPDQRAHHDSATFDRPPMYPGSPVGGGPTGAKSPPQPTSPTSGMNSGAPNGYVPYANIYGQPVYDASRDVPQQPFSPAPMSNAGSVQPNSRNQLAAHPVAPQPYHQNPYAQDAPLGSQPAYYPDPYAGRYDDRYNEYDDGPRHRRRHHRRDDSRDSYDSYDSRPSSSRRTRSERRDDDRTRLDGRGKSRVREMFDTSQKGLGYSAVGALAGGLVGSEVGKGAMPKVIGAAVGALGANAFQAREKKKHEARQVMYDRDGPMIRGSSRRRRDEGYRSE